MNLNFSPRKDHKALVFKNNVYVIGGVDGYAKKKFKPVNDIWISDKLNKWILLTKNFLHPLRMDFSAVVFKDKIWIIGGYFRENGYYLNDVWNSEDGLKWKQVILSAPFKGRANAALFVFKNKLWLIGGTVSPEGRYISDIWFSETGMEWNKASEELHLFSYYECPVKVLGDRVFIFIYGEGIYSSSDCLNWEKLQLNDGRLDKRFFYGVESFDGNLYIMCGENQSAYYSFGGHLNEVWKSPDGTNWTMVSPYPESVVDSAAAYPPFSIKPGRCNPATFLYKGKLCLSGGIDEENNFLNDIWYTEDGARWFMIE